MDPPAPPHGRRCPPDPVRRTLLLGAAAAALSGCAPPEPTRIGFVGGLSGRNSDLGVNGRNGAQLAVEALNQEAGATAYELLVQDDGNDAERLRQSIRTLQSQGAAFIVGPMTSAMGMVAAPAASQAGITMISPTVTTHQLSGRADHFFRVVADAVSGAEREALLLRQRGHATMAIAMEVRNRAFSESWGNAAGRRFTGSGGKVVTELGFESSSETDFRTLAAQLLLRAPDVVLIVSGAVDAALLAQQLRQREPALALATAPWAATEDLLQMGGAAVEGMLTPQYFDRESRTPAYLAFVERHLRRFDEAPGYAAVNAYDALMLGVQALRRAGRHGTLASTLTTPGIAWSGLQRDIALDAFGDTTNDLTMTEVKAGRFVTVGP